MRGAHSMPGAAENRGERRERRKPGTHPRRADPARRGSALMAVLWCFIILALVVLAALSSTRLELRVAKNSSDLEEARWLAVAGIEKAKSAIHESRKKLRAEGKSHDPALRSDPAAFREVAFGRGIFSVVRSAEPGESAERVAYGITDEEGRLDVNRASVEEIAKLPGMTREIAAAIGDWRDDDDEVTPGGAEREDYAALVPPYFPRNGNIETIRELLLVRGVTPELLFGEDSNANGLLDPEEDDGPLSPPADDADGVLQAGWSALLTIHSAAENVTARGEKRVNVQNAGADALSAVDGISGELAKAIVEHRGRSEIESLADLFDVEAAASGSQQGQAKSAKGSSDAPAGDSGGSGRSGSGGGQKLVNEELLKQIADGLTMTDDLEEEGTVNINTADPQVLSCLPGIDRDLADAIVARRREVGFFSSIADLLDVPGLGRQVWKGIASRITVRSGTFRIAAEGRVAGTGALRRIHAIVRPGSYQVETLDWREEP